jgi:hypothetical protein
MGFTKYPMQSSGYPLEEAPPIPIRDCIKRNHENAHWCDRPISRNGQVLETLPLPLSLKSARSVVVQPTGWIPRVMGLPSQGLNLGAGSQLMTTPLLPLAKKGRGLES